MLASFASVTAPSAMRAIGNVPVPRSEALPEVATAARLDVLAFSPSAVLRSVWSESVPVIPPHAAEALMTRSPLPRMVDPLSVLMFVPETSVSCFAERAEARSACDASVPVMEPQAAAAAAVPHSVA